MKNIATAVLPIILAMATGASAEMMSPAYIQQLDNARSSSMSSMEIIGMASSAATELAALRPATGNLAMTWQEGLFNNATITQSGSGNVGLIRQIGAYNTASISQIGQGHAALINQQGRGNVAIIRQR
jgi:hypothetical protein